MKRNLFMKIVTRSIQEVSFKYLLNNIKFKCNEIYYGTKLKCPKKLNPPPRKKYLASV